MARKFYLDTEFHGYNQRHKLFGKFPVGKARPVIDLISVGIVDEVGHSIYLVCNEFDLDDAWANDWLRCNVLMGIYEELKKEYEGELGNNQVPIPGRTLKQKLAYLLSEYGFSREEIKKEIEIYFMPKIDDENDKIEVYGYMCDYDWVAFGQLWGGFNKMPKYLPYLMYDLKQMANEKGISSWSIPQPNEHNALGDAIFNKELHEFIIRVAGSNMGSMDRKQTAVYRILKAFLDKMYHNALVTDGDGLVTLMFNKDIWAANYESITKSKGWLELDATIQLYLEDLTKYVK